MDKKKLWQGRRAWICQVNWIILMAYKTKPIRITIDEYRHQREWKIVKG
jgi:hypothetical protein